MASRRAVSGAITAETSPRPRAAMVTTSAAAGAGGKGIAPAPDGDFSGADAHCPGRIVAGLARLDLGRSDHRSSSFPKKGIPFLETMSM
jgi:hypothetical protein